MATIAPSWATEADQCIARNPMNWTMNPQTLVIVPTTVLNLRWNLLAGSVSMAIFVSLRFQNQGLCLLRKNRKRLENLVVDGFGFLQPDNSSLLPGYGAISLLARAVLDNMGNKSVSQLPKPAYQLRCTERA